MKNIELKRPDSPHKYEIIFKGCSWNEQPSWHATVYWIFTNPFNFDDDADRLFEFSFIDKIVPMRKALCKFIADKTDEGYEVFYRD